MTISSSKENAKFYAMHENITKLTLLTLLLLSWAIIIYWIITAPKEEEDESNI